MRLAIVLVVLALSSIAAADVKDLVGGLDRPHTRELTQKLVELGDPAAIAPLGEAWKRGSPFAFHAMIELAGKTGAWPQAVPYVRAAIMAFDPNVWDTRAPAREAIESLSSANPPDAVELLVPIVTSKPGPDIASVQRAAVSELPFLDATKAGPLLIAALSHERTPSQAELDIAALALEALDERPDPRAVEALAIAMYRWHDRAVSDRARRVLLKIGPAARPVALRILRGEHAAVDALLRKHKLDVRCDDKGAACKPTSLRDALAAWVLGGLRDERSVPDLLAALARPTLPTGSDELGMFTQTDAIAEALAKIGATAAAEPIRAAWRATAKGYRGDLIDAYARVARDASAVDELVRIAIEPGTPFLELRSAAEAVGMLATDARSLAPLLAHAAKLRGGKAVAPEDVRMEVLELEAHVARVAVANRCKKDAACYVQILDLSSKELATALGVTWTAESQGYLMLAAAERAMLELSRLGRQPPKIVDQLLARLGDGIRIQRAIARALPSLVAAPCAPCSAKLGGIRFLREAEDLALYFAKR